MSGSPARYHSVAHSLACARHLVKCTACCPQVRVLRLLKLVRLARGSRIFKRWELRLSINYAVLDLETLTMQKHHVAS